MAGRKGLVRASELSVLTAGALMPLGYAPFSLFPIVPLLLAVLFYRVGDCGPRRAFWRAWLFGFTMFGVGVSWVYTSIHEFGHAWAPAAAALTVLFAAVLALFVGLGAMLAVLAARGNRRVLWLGTLPAGWVLLEWVKGWFLTFLAVSGRCRTEPPASKPGSSAPGPRRSSGNLARESQRRPEGCLQGPRRASSAR